MFGNIILHITHGKTRLPLLLVHALLEQRNIIPFARQLVL